MTNIDKHEITKTEQKKDNRFVLIDFLSSSMSVLYENENKSFED